MTATERAGGVSSVVTPGLFVARFGVQAREFRYSYAKEASPGVVN